MAKGKGRIEDKTNIWHRHIERWRRSRLSQQKYCEENKIKKSTFLYWVRKISKTKRHNRFIELSLGELLQDHIEIVFKEEFKIRLRNNFNPELLIEIINTLVKTI